MSCEGNPGGDGDGDGGLKPKPVLYGASASMYFSDSLLFNFLFPYAVVLGVSFDQMGLMRSARNLCQNMLQILWGEVAERFGKRFLVAIGYLLSGCFIVAFLYFRDPFQLLVLMIAQSIFWSAAAPAWSSLLADYTSIRTRGRVLGKIGSVSRLSSVGATLIVAITAYTQPAELTAGSFIIPFALSATAAFITALLVLFVEESRVRKVTLGWRDVVSPLLDKRFRTFLIVNGFYWFTMAFSWPLFPYVIVNVVHAAVWQIAVISAVSGLLMSITQPKFGSFIDRVGRRLPLIVSRASFFLFPLLYAFATEWLHLLLINVLLSFPMSAVIVSLTAYIMDSAPPGRRANYTAATNMIYGLAAFLGSLIGGIFTMWLSASIGMRQALFIGLVSSATLRLISSLSLLLIRETLPGKS